MVLMVMPASRDPEKTEAGLRLGNVFLTTLGHTLTFFVVSAPGRHVMLTLDLRAAIIVLVIEP